MKKIKVVVFSLLFLFVPFLAIGEDANIGEKAKTGTGWNLSVLRDKTGLPSESISYIISQILTWILVVFGFLAVIGFIISGIMYILSAGDEDSMKKAKKAFIYSIIGVVVALSGLVIIYAIDTALRGDL